MTRAERRVLARLGDGRWHRESALRTTFRVLQQMHLRGLVDGAMATTGATPTDRLWRINLRGDAK